MRMKLFGLRRVRRYDDAASNQELTSTRCTSALSQKLNRSESLASLRVFDKRRTIEGQGIGSKAFGDEGKAVVAPNVSFVEANLAAAVSALRCPLSA
jgi:hypothetical protein